MLGWAGGVPSSGIRLCDANVPVAGLEEAGRGGSPPGRATAHGAAHDAIVDRTRPAYARHGRYVGAEDKGQRARGSRPFPL